MCNFTGLTISIDSPGNLRNLGHFGELLATTISSLEYLNLSIGFRVLELEGLEASFHIATLNRVLEITAMPISVPTSGRVTWQWAANGVALWSMMVGWTPRSTDWVESRVVSGELRVNDLWLYRCHVAQQKSLQGLPIAPLPGPFPSGIDHL
jgi:hypothetical protein